MEVALDKQLRHSQNINYLARQMTNQRSDIIWGSQSIIGSSGLNDCLEEEEDE